MKDFCIILLDGGTPADIAKIHEQIKAHATTWWHRFSRAWIVKGGTPKEWRDRLRPFVTPGTSVLVLRLKPDAKSTWAFFGADAEKRTNWLRNTYRLDDE